MVLKFKSITPNWTMTVPEFMTADASFNMWIKFKAEFVSVYTNMSMKKIGKIQLEQTYKNEKKWQNIKLEYNQYLFLI